MAYCLVKVSGKFTVIDEDLIDGPTLVGEPVKVMAGESREDGVMFAKGRKSEMEKEKKAFEVGKETMGKRERKKRATLFDAGSPPPPPLKAPKIERGGAAKAVSQRVVQPVAVEDEEVELEDLSIDDVIEEEDAPLPNNASALDLLQQLLRGQQQILREMGEIKQRISILERNSRTTAEAAACTRTELLARKNSMNKVEAGWETLDSTLKAVAESLPPPSKAIYTFLSEPEVDCLDIKKDDINAFAAKVDDVLFDSNERTKNLKKRDQKKVKWLLETVLHRRKASVTGNYDWIYGRVTESLNDRARRLLRNKIKASSSSSSAPSLLPASTAPNVPGPSPPLPSPSTALSQMHLFPTSPSPVPSHTSLAIFPTPSPTTMTSQTALFKTPTRPVSLLPPTASIGIPAFPKSESTSPKSYTDL